ncbi:MAG: hypothetical protein KBF43_09105 [Dermatophilaceae bacterium]|nr:hypothetical protein [Dermatophilaceae bacterium]
MRLNIRAQTVEGREVPAAGDYATMQQVAEWCSGLVCNSGAAIRVNGLVARPGNVIVEDITPGCFVVVASLADLDRVYAQALA